MSDLFESYKKGLDRLLETMGKDHSDYNKALAQRNRLIENIENAELHGDDPTSKAERNVILLNLDKIALRAIRKSFHELYELNRKPSTNKPPSNKQQPAELDHVQRPKHITSASNKPDHIQRSVPVTPTWEPDYKSTIANIEYAIDTVPPILFTDEFIVTLVNKITDTITWLRSPAAIEEKFRVKEAVLTYLRDARAKFSHAVQEYRKKKGQTERFFNDIEAGRLCLEKALNYW